ncbi:MAG: hypothetical protein O3A10_00560 [Chloroflexi bacterium]|nr:hypothetical protein [Chloroflexota bacterium]
MRALVALAVVATILGAACGEVPRPGDPPPTPTEPVIVNAEGIPGAAGQPLGPYTPASDVSFEVRTNAAIEQLSGLLLDPATVDWDAVREAYEAAPAPIGSAVPPSLAAVAASAATGPLGASYIEEFGSAAWLTDRALAAISGSGEFADRSAADRAAVLSNLFAIEVPLVRALVALEAGERLTSVGDLDRAFGAPHEWDRVWVILQGAPALNGVLNEETLAAILAGSAAAASGDTAAVRDAHDVVHVALLRTALEGIALEGVAAAQGQASPEQRARDLARGGAFLRGVQPLLSRVDAATTRRLSALLERDVTPGAIPA